MVCDGAGRRRSFLGLRSRNDETGRGELVLVSSEEGLKGRRQTMFAFVLVVGGEIAIERTGEIFVALHIEENDKSLSQTGVDIFGEPHWRDD